MTQQNVQEVDDLVPGHDLAARRRQRLILLVESRGAARLEELSAALGGSPAPVRASPLLAVARLPHGGSRLTVVTNSLPVATELVGRGPRLIMIGGELRATSRAIVGPLTRHLLEDLHVDRALMGTFAPSLDDGLT